MEVDEYLIPSQAEQYHFFQLVELLYKLKGTEIDGLLNQPPGDEPVRFVGNASLAYVTRDITSVAAKDGKFEVKVPFLSLTGAHSPLPNYYLDAFSWEELQEDPRITALLDLFNHRLTTFLYKIWRKYRYFVCFKQNGQDEFSQRMFSLVGIGPASIRDSLHVNQSKMLSYAGILANSGRSPQLLAALISHCFELPEVKIKSWQFRRVAIPEPQKNKVGVKNCTLGKNFIIGGRIPDYSGKFTLVISNLTLEKMQMFLPTGSLHHSLVNFVSFILRDQLAWDLQLVLANDQVEGMKLGANRNCYLGWTTFLGRPPVDPSALITIQE